MRILYLTWSAAPYRVALLNELHKKCEVFAVYEKRSEEITNRDPAWFREERETYPYAYPSGGGILKVLKGRKFDAAVVCGYTDRITAGALLYMRLKKIPLLICADGMPEKRKDPYAVPRRILLSLADGYLLSGQVTERNLRRYLAKRPVFLFPLTSLRENEISVPGEEEKERLKRKYGLTEKKIVLAAGQFIERKGYDLLLECLPLPEDTGLYIAGAEPPEKWRRLKDPRLHFPGFLDHRTLTDYMRAADVFVHPALQEIWGIVIPEAMCAGCCVITTDHCIAGEELIRSNENGILVRAGDREQLRRSLKAVLEDDALRQRLGKEAAETAKEMSVEKSAEAHYRALLHIAGRDDDGSEKGPAV